MPYKYYKNIQKNEQHIFQLDFFGTFQFSHLLFDTSYF